MADIETGERLKPGERGFSIFLAIFGLFALYESIKLFQKDPRWISFGAFPLILSILLIVFSVHVFWSDRKKKTETDEASVDKKILKTLDYLFPKTVTILLILMILYCLALYFELGFELSSTVFLLVALCFFRKNQYIKNVLYTVLTMAFILLIFKLGFRILLP